MPLTLPSQPGNRSITWMPQAAVRKSVSPFTFAPQTFDYGSARWKVVLSLPPMTRAKADEWMAFFAKVRDQEFYLGDSSRADVSTTETPTLASAVSSGSVFSTTGWTPNQADLLKPGDWFDITAANGKKALFQVSDSVSSDGSGNATINVFPNARTTINSGQALNFTSPVGVFLLDDFPALEFDSNKLLQGFSFEASQVQ